MKRKNTWLAWALAVGLISYLVGAATVSRSAVAPTPISAYASGIALHADAIQAGLAGPRIVGADLAYSSAQLNSAGFAPVSPQNELQLNLQPTDKEFAGKNASARGAGLELGIASDLPANAGDALAQTQAGSVAPPTAAPEIKDAGLGDALAPLAYASLLHSEAASQWNGNPCLTTAVSPISYGRGYAADAQLLNTGDEAPDGRFEAPLVATDDPLPERSVVQTKSYVYAVPNGNVTGGQHYGLVSEIHQTYAPVSLNRGPLLPLIIEVLGEWVFKTTATGLKDNPATPAVNEGAHIEYYTLDDVTHAPVSPTTDIIRVSQDGGLTYTGLQAQQIFTNGGLVLPAALAPLVGLAIGEDPRAIAAPGATPDPASVPAIDTVDGTFARGAVDVVRLSLLNVAVGTHVADLRIGHFESALSVPAGGFTCPPDPTTTTTTAPTTTSSSTTSTSTSTTSTSTSSTSTTSTTQAPTTTTVRPATTTTTTPPAPAPVPTPIVVSPKLVG